MESLIALDIETTGLDPAADSIIEIGAVRFRGTRVEEEWTTLVNPGRPIPGFITQLTGITDEMVAQAPRVDRVLADLQDLVGYSPILGHRVAFDLSFMRKHGLFSDNPSLDTYDLASVIMPNAARYSLVGLANSLQIPVASSHRALDDAQTTYMVFNRLFEQLLDLPLTLLQIIVRMGEDLDWGAGWIFEEALDQRIDAGEEVDRDISFNVLDLFSKGPIPGNSLQTAEEVVPLDSEALAATLEPGGALSKAFPGYEHRSQQVRMLRAVADSLSEYRHMLIEAGTGTGKSLAYLIPAFAWADKNGQRVVVSTNTINLQDQLIHKDIPNLISTLKEDYRAAVLKGRANYLCPRRLAAFTRIGPQSADEIRVLAKVLVWLYRGGTGDVNEINLRGAVESAIWSKLSSNSEDCSLEACRENTGGVCPYYQAREAAERAHVIVVNHALLLADIATGSRVVPEYNYLIVDEAHHLEPATTHGLSFQVTQRGIERILRDLGASRGGTLHRIRSLIEKDLPKDMVGGALTGLEDIENTAGESVRLNQRFFHSLAEFMEERREGRPVSPYGQEERIVAGLRTLPEWSQIEIIWDDYRVPLSAIQESLIELHHWLQEISDTGLQAAEDLAVVVRTMARDLTEILEMLDEMIFESDPQKIYWISLEADRPLISLHAAPLEVGPLVEQHLWHEKDSVVMTSATLTTGGQFDYLRQRLNADEAEELALGSPFDFESSTLLYLINDIPEPQDRRGYQRAIEQGLIQICQATGGRTLALFTSTMQLRQTANAIGPVLAAKGIVVLEQTSGVSRHALLDAFRTTEQAVLLGTRSFWEGVDVPGEALSVLAIIRLPFDVPSDPIVAARSETYEYPFQEYAVPEAILRFRQGFGRLIRTRSDRGVVTSFDSRLLTKTYGKAFIDSLPRCTLRTGPLANLPREAARWLGI